MKKLSAIITIFLSVAVHAQRFYAEFEVGMSNAKSATLGPSIGFTAHNAFVQADWIVFTSNYQPVMPGLRTGYTFHVGDFAVQGFIGRHYQWYTTDKYDAWKNHFSNMFGMKLYYGIWFIQAQVSDKNILSFGLTEKF